MELGNVELLKDIVKHHGLNDGPIDIILSCVDNYAARISINSICCSLNQPWMESGVSEDAFSGHIQLVLPGRTACFQCLPPIAIVSGIDEKTIRRGGVCAASLPTTMGIIAGFLVQNVLKYLLDFGQVSYYLGYSAMNNYFPTDILYPCPDCPNEDCKKLQHIYKNKWTFKKWEPKTCKQEFPSLEVDNEWGITYPVEHAE